MRNYIATIAATHVRVAGFLGLRAYFRRRQERHEFQALRELPECYLRDIGLTRQQVEYLCGMPLNHNLGWEAERLRLLAARHPLSAE